MANDIHDEEDWFDIDDDASDDDDVLLPEVMDKNEVIQAVNNKNERGSLDATVDKGVRQIASLREQNITRADFDNGQKFDHNHETNISTLANSAISLSLGEHGLKVLIPNPNSSPDEVLQDFDNMSESTQRMRGAGVGRSQPWVSNQDNDDE